MSLNKICPICLESFIGNKIDRFVKLPCKHLYHEKCIGAYFDYYNKDNCPCTLCRISFNKLNLKDREPLRWTLRNRVNTNKITNYHKIDNLYKTYLINPIKNIKCLDHIVIELQKYILNISKTSFIRKIKKKTITFHLKTATNYFLTLLPLYKKVRNDKKANVLKTDFIYFLSKLESNNHIDQKILKKIYKSI